MTKEAKIHLLRPSEDIGMCGLRLALMTRRPERMTCKICTSYYELNVKWFEEGMARMMQNRRKQNGI